MLTVLIRCHCKMVISTLANTLELYWVPLYEMLTIGTNNSKVKRSIFPFSVEFEDEAEAIRGGPLLGDPFNVIVNNSKTKTHFNYKT